MELIILLFVMLACLLLILLGGWSVFGSVLGWSLVGLIVFLIIFVTLNKLFEATLARPLGWLRNIRNKREIKKETRREIRRLEELIKTKMDLGYEIEEYEIELSKKRKIL